MKNKTKQKRYASKKSYWKTGGMMLLGAAIGASAAMLGLFGHQAIADGTARLLRWLGRNAGMLMGSWIGLELLLGGICSYRMRKLGETMREAEAKDLDADAAEYRLNRWNAVFSIFSGISLFLALFLMIVGIDECMSRRTGQTAFGILAAFLLVFLVQSVFQIRIVKLVQTIDPRKYGDPADFSFAKDWFAGCDEGERQMLYQAAYHTNRFVSILIWILLILAVLGHTLWKTGLFSIAVLGILGVGQTAAYQIYALRRMKSGQQE